MTTTLRLCRSIARLLAAHDGKLVLAESCTAGLVSATLARVPGISEYLCGSAVTYRNETKAAWLGVPVSALASPGPVSRLVASWMAERALVITPEANLAASVTGHLGPLAPARHDGIVYIGVAVRRRTISAKVRRVKLQAVARTRRQQEATHRVLAALHETLARW